MGKGCIAVAKPSPKIIWCDQGKAQPAANSSGPVSLHDLLQSRRLERCSRLKQTVGCDSHLPRLGLTIPLFKQNWAQYEWPSYLVVRNPSLVPFLCKEWTFGNESHPAR